MDPIRVELVGVEEFLERYEELQRKVAVWLSPTVAEVKALRSRLTRGE